MKQKNSLRGVFLFHLAVALAKDGLPCYTYDSEII
jgi:hypothetical protein